MTEWSRKNLDELYFSIRQELKIVDGLDDKCSFKLISIQVQIETSFWQTEGDLKQCRSQICEACRAHKLYDCDLEVGWSPNCAFIRHHKL
jgi:hypothetical protein